MTHKLFINPDALYTRKEASGMFMREYTDKRYFAYLRTRSKRICLNKQRRVKRYKKYVITGFDLYKLISEIMPKILPLIRYDYDRYK